jgi:hypothetical protein
MIKLCIGAVIGAFFMYLWIRGLVAAAESETAEARYAAARALHELSVALGITGQDQH